MKESKRANGHTLVEPRRRHSYSKVRILDVGGTRVPLTGRETTLLVVLLEDALERSTTVAQRIDRRAPLPEPLTPHAVRVMASGLLHHLLTGRGFDDHLTVIADWRAEQLRRSK